MSSPQSLQEDQRHANASAAELSPADQSWLESYLQQAGAVAGTLHRAAPGGLRLTAARNIPPPVQALVAWVPEGKGMAGQAMKTRLPVSTCNLKEDPSATVRPGARTVDAQAAVALPLCSASGMVVAVVGLAYGDGRDLPAETIAHLTKFAEVAITHSETGNTEHNPD